MEIKLFITDIDGVWTDGGMYYDNSGNELKKFNTRDSAGVLFLKEIEIPLAIITGENTQLLKNRAKKLKIKYLFEGIKNKLIVAEKLCQELNISLNEVAFIGDDLGDIELLKNVGLSATPADAPDYVKSVADWTLNKKGGEGVFREFVEKYLKDKGLLDSCIQNYLKQINETNNS